ncbi:MAG: methylglyoxal synthase [Bacteroidota bacterium]
MSKCIALVAHDACKQDLVDWVGYNWEKLHRYDLVCTGTTGRLVQEILEQKLLEHGQSGLSLERLKSGPLGGDQQLGARIAEGRVHLFVFFWDPMTPQPHDVDVKALLRIATMYNLPTATNRATADFLISSPLFDEPYQPQRLKMDDYLNRPL